MKKVDVSAIKNLIAYEGEPALTLYIPTHRYPTPPSIQEDQTRFKNLVRQGCDQWRQQMDDAAVAAIETQLESYLSRLDFWQESIETLAVFASREGIQMYRLPIETEERVYVGTRFDITPLLLVESMNQPAYVFALAMHEPRLFRADLYGMEEISVDFPKSPEDALNIDEMFSNSNTIRSGRSAGPNSIPAAPHGQGDASGAGHEERFMYLRLLDEKIRHLQDFDESLPFIIASTDTEFGDFRSISKMKNIVDVHIPGNHTNSSLPEFHQQVTLLLREHIAATRFSKTLERIQELQGVRASFEASDIAAAAEIGKIETLLVPMFDMTADSVADHQQPEPLIRFDDRFDESTRSIVSTVAANGGSIVGVERGSLPNMSAMAALYRY